MRSPREVRRNYFHSKIFLMTFQLWTLLWNRSRNCLEKVKGCETDWVELFTIFMLILLISLKTEMGSHHKDVSTLQAAKNLDLNISIIIASPASSDCFTSWGQWLWCWFNTPLDLFRPSEIFLVGGCQRATCNLLTGVGAGADMTWQIFLLLTRNNIYLMKLKI